MNKDRLYLESIRECLDRIEDYAAGDEDAFMNSHLIQDGVIRNLELIGEATKILVPNCAQPIPRFPGDKSLGCETC